MPDRTPAAGRRPPGPARRAGLAGAHSCGAGRGRITRGLAAATLTFGLTAGTTAGALAVDALAAARTGSRAAPPATAAHAAASPRCPRIPVPATPPPAAPPGGNDVPAARRDPTTPGTGCRRPPKEPDVLVPEAPAATPAPPVSTRDRRRTPTAAAEPPRNAPEPRAAPAAPRVRPRPTDPPPATPPATPPAQAHGYGGGMRADPGLGPAYGRSLIYSGALGLLLASLGMVLVGHRRRGW